MRTLEVPKVFVDERSTRILMAALPAPRSGAELSRMCGIPVAHCFYRLKVLEKRGLMEKVVMEIDGRGVVLYRSRLRTAYVHVDRGTAKITFRLEHEEPWTEDAAMRV